MRKMKMRGWLSLLLGAVMLMISIPMGARAEGERLALKGISALRLAETGTLGLSVYVTDTYGTGMKLEPTDFQVQINGQSVSAVKDQAARQGHIYVVDCSRQNNSKFNNTKELVSSLLRGMVNYQNAGDGTAVVWVGELIETEGFGADNLEKNYQDKRDKNGKNTARLFDGILRAVNLAKSGESGYDFYHIYIITDGMDNNSGTTLDYIAREIQESTPLDLFTCCYYNGQQNYYTSEAARAARTAMRNFTASVGGNFVEVDMYYKDQLEGNIQKAMNMVSNTTLGTQFLSVSLQNLQLDRENGKTEISVGTTTGASPVSQVVYLSTSALPTPTPTPEPTVGPTPTPGPFAVWGDQNSENVKYLQARLNKYGFLDKEPSGNFDQATKDAVLAYMGLTGMTAKEENGILYLSQEDWDRIQNTEVTPSPAPTEEPFIIGGQQNSTENVRELQEFLKANGWYDGEIDGSFYGSTQNAYRALMDFMGARVDEPITITRPYFERLKGSAPTATPAPTPAPTVEIVVRKDSGAVKDTVLQDNVKRLQELLTRTHYYYGEIDGDFGYKTQEAYAALLTKLGWEQAKVDGENGMVIPRGQWDNLWSYQESDLPTAAPTATPTPTPEPTTDPDKAYRDLKLGDEDGEDEDYVSRMQNRLWNLGYYTYVGVDRTPGHFDEQTQKALKAFFDQNGMSSEDGSKLSKGIWRNNLDGESALKAPEPEEKSFIERVREFLTRDVTQIGGFTIKMWMLAAVAGVLLLAIIIVLVMIISRNRRRKKEQDAPDGPGTSAPGNTIKYKGPVGSPAPVPAPAPTPAPKPGSTGHIGGTVSGSDDETWAGGTMPTGGSEETMAYGEAAGKVINLEISYNGNRTPVTATIYDELIIGRRKENTRVDVMTDPADKTVSRPHCKLILKGDQIFIKNLSVQARGTLLNGHKVQEGDDFGLSQGASPAEDGETMSLNENPIQTPTGLEQVHSGDEITIGQHHIIVSWYE